MVVEIKTRADMVSEVKVNGEEAITITRIGIEYAKEKDYIIFWDEDGHFISKKDEKCASLYLEKINDIDETEKNYVCEYNIDSLKEQIDEIINEINEKIKELENEKTVILEYN